MGKQKEKKILRRKKRLERDLLPSDFIIDENYPTEFVSTEPRIYVNLAHGLNYDFITFDDIVFGTMRAILVETICFHMQRNNPDFEIECKRDCVPHQKALMILKEYFGLEEVIVDIKTGMES